MGKYIIKFFKDEKVKYVSHLDTVRMFGRTMRRAGITMSMSQGFNPHPIMTFANPIGIGISSRCELALIGVDEEISPKDLAITLNEHLPSGFKVLAAKKEFAKSPFTSLTFAQYKITVSGEITDPVKLLDMPEIIMPKKTKSGVKDTDIKPFIRSVFADGQTLFATVRCGETNLKPELLIEALEKYTDFRIDEYKTERTALLDENLNDLIEF